MKAAALVRGRGLVAMKKAARGRGRGRPARKEPAFPGADRLRKVVKVMTTNAFRADYI